VRDDDRPQPTDDRQEPPTVTGGNLRLTYGQIGKRLGITADAARQLARRKGWSRTRPNRIGEPAIVSVPANELSGHQPSVNHPATDDEPADNRRSTDGQPKVTNGAAPTVADSESPSDNRRSDLSVAVDTLHAAVELLGQQLQAERTRADRAEERANGIQDQLEAARREAQEARQAAEKLKRADDAWKTQTTWQRIRAAIRRG
jgi:hypothetical protein